MLARAAAYEERLALANESREGVTEEGLALGGVAVVVGLEAIASRPHLVWLRSG